MLFRVATTADIPQIQKVRNAVHENRLSDPALVSDDDCRIFITTRGKGWVCETDGRIVGFAIADLREDNIWALFVDPAYERRGIGRQLHDRMLDWYFDQGKEKVWLGTAPHTRAERFYQRSGWTVTGRHGRGETKMELSARTWTAIREKSVAGSS